MSTQHTLGNLVDIVRKANEIAFERGKRDSENHVRLVNAGERGMYTKNAYPSNPYSKKHDRIEWESYNRGWNSVAF